LAMRGSSLSARLTGADPRERASGIIQDLSTHAFPAARLDAKRSSGPRSQRGARSDQAAAAE
jgi:hypothetical protein